MPDNKTLKYSKEFKEYLIKQLKISAQTIIDNVFPPEAINSVTGEVIK